MRSRLGQVGIGAVILGMLTIAVVGLVRGSGSGDRAYRLEQQLRCPVCESVSIADSPSTTAQAMRADVERQIRAGRTDQKIIDYFRARYGDWVQLDPPTHGITLAVWLLPLAAAAIGIAVVLARVRRRHDPLAAVTLREEDDW
jgi:cytochrome c-type biogenesis protein CcmH